MFFRETLKMWFTFFSMLVKTFSALISLGDIVSVPEKKT